MLVTDQSRHLKIYRRSSFQYLFREERTRELEINEGEEKRRGDVSHVDTNIK